MKEGWETKVWAEVLDIRSGRNQKEVISPNGTYPILGSAGKVMGYATEYLCEANTTILGRKGTIDKPLFIETKFWNVDTAFGLVANEGLNSRFLHYFCLGYNFQKHNKGTTLPSLVKKDLVKIQIPVPPLAEQEAIVEVLDKAFAAIDQAKANIEQNIANAKEFFQSKLNQIFSQKGEGWVERGLDDVCDIVAKLADPREELYLDLLHVGGANIESKTGSLINLKTAREEGLKSGKFPFNTTMVLYSKIRPYLEKVARPNFEGLCSADIYPLTPRTRVLTRNFLYHLLLTPDFTDYAIEGSGRAGMPKVNRTHLFSYRFHLPPLTEQEKIAHELDVLSKSTQEIESHYQTKLASLEELKKSILQKAFTGELT